MSKKADIIICHHLDQPDTYRRFHKLANAMSAWIVLMRLESSGRHAHAHSMWVEMEDLACTRYALSNGNGDVSYYT